MRTLGQSAAGFSPDFIYSPTYRGYGLPAMVVARRRHVPYALYIHGTEVNTETRASLRRKLMQLVLHGAAFIAVNSAHTKERLFQAFPKLPTPTTVIPPGVSIEPFLAPGVAERARTLRHEWQQMAGTLAHAAAPEGKARPEPLVIVSLCRQVRAKGIDLTLQALADIRMQAPEQRFIYVAGGTGPDMESFREQAASLQLNEVLFPGPISPEDAAAFLVAGDFYVQPSQPVNDFIEGFGISFLEAHAAGLPCIASNWGGIPEATEPGKTALLVPVGDRAALTAAIIRLMNDRQLRLEMSQNALARARAMSWSAHAQKLLGLIDNASQHATSK